MSTNISENKSIAYSSSQGYGSPNELTIFEETEKIRLLRPESKYNPAVNISQQQKLPDFYELKIRVRKYDFL